MYLVLLATPRSTTMNVYGHVTLDVTGDPGQLGELFDGTK